MHYFPIIPTCARHFLTNKDESFDDDLTSQISEIIKTNNLVKNVLASGMKPNAKDLQRLFFASTLITTTEKKSKHSASGHAYERINDILRRKGGHLRKHLCRNREIQEAKTLLGGDGSLKINQVGVPKDICKTLGEKHIREKKLNYIQKGEWNMSLKFQKPLIDIGDILHVLLMEGD